MFEGYVEKSQNRIAAKMVDDAVILNHYGGTSLEELVNIWSYLLGPELVDQSGKSPGIGEQNRHFAEATHLPVGVSKVAQIRVFEAPADAKQAPNLATQPGEMHLAVQH